MRIMLDVADISSLHPVLCYEPELISDASIAHWRAPGLPRLPSFSFQQRISRQRQTQRKRQLDWWVKQELLKRVNNAMLIL
jgi:hypothetical protein